MTRAELRTARMWLRMWRAEDAADLARIYEDERVTAMLPPMDFEQCKAQIHRFEEKWEKDGFCLWAAEDLGSGKFAGRVGLIRHEDSPDPDTDVEIGWTFDPQFWGRGLATEGALASLEFGFGALNLDRIISITRPENAKSRAVMERIGMTFRYEAEWRGYGQVIYAITREEFEAKR